MSNIDQMVENVRLGRLTFANLRKDFEAAGFIVGDDYSIDPETGRITHMSLIITDGYSREEAEAIFARHGSLLRHSLQTGNAAFKLHDFGYRGQAGETLTAPPSTEHMMLMYDNGKLTSAVKKL